MEKQLNGQFWAELANKYPAEIERFVNWFKQYQIKHKWEDLFNQNFAMLANAFRPVWFEDLPDAMQIGIFIEYVAEQDHNFGIELPKIENKDDFSELCNVICDFFFYEHEGVQEIKDQPEDGQ